MDYPSDLAKWQEVAIPPKSDMGNRMVWFYAANYSKYEWRVFLQDGKPHAQLTTEARKNPPTPLPFAPQAGRFKGAFAFVRVDDGWLVGFNQGEFGAALYWFSPDGKRSYEVSDHQVVDFFVLPSGVHAIEGLAHLGISQGSVIQITKSSTTGQWQASSVVKLPSAPYAISLRRDHAMLVTLADALVSVGVDRKLKTLLADVPWGGLYPNSSVLPPDERKLYIGMRQFVGEFDLATNNLRLLIPSRQFLNKRSKEDEDSTRKMYSR